MLLEARSQYITRLRSTLSSLTEEGRSVYAEICLEFERPNALNDVYRLYVADIVERLPNGETSIIEVNVEPSVVYEPGLPIDTALAWNGIEFRCSPDDFPIEALASWATRWIYDESPPLGAQDGLTGIIHSVTEPTCYDLQIEFSVDFGSAPVAALDELLTLLGSSLRSIGSYALTAGTA